MQFFRCEYCKSNDQIKKVLEHQTKLSEILTTQNWRELPLLLGDSMLYIHSFGRVDTKAEFLKNIAKFIAIPRWEYSDTKVQLYKNFAVVTSNLYVTLKLQDGSEQISQQRCTEVWKKEKKIWIMVNHQSTSFK
jgi:hypothetical protein